MTAPRLGVSSCLLGEKVRYDGGDKRERYICETLGEYFELVPVCPEVAVGLGVPRPPIRLVGRAAAPRAIGVEDPRLDVTARLERFGARASRQLAGISGYIFKARSPSCGLFDTPVATPRGARRGRGVYAAALTARLPLLPVEDETGLADPQRRERFLERVFAYRRWQEFSARAVTAARLVEFHAAHKLALLVHGRTHYRALGQLVARAGRGSMRALAQQYGEHFMRAFAAPATRGRHADALTHALGFLKGQLEPEDRRELREAIEDYRTGGLPWLVPATLINHHLRRQPQPWLAAQVYLRPDAAELALRRFD